jgi:DNA-binding beta-propeller fold protein YncE
MKLRFCLPALIVAVQLSCHKPDQPYLNEDAATFTEISSISIVKGSTAEINTFDPDTKKLFVVTNSGTSGQIAVVDLTIPAMPVIKSYIDMSSYGGLTRSVAVKDGKLAVSVEAVVKTDPGKIIIFRTADYSVIRQVVVGALPDMITFTPDGQYILCANEGEPNAAYTIDPPGTISIIAVEKDYAVSTIDFSSFASQMQDLQAKGLRIFGPRASFAQDIEPEYITVSSDCRTAWVTLQENNGIARLDIPSKSITAIFPLGFKRFDVDENAIDPSDRDGGIFLNKWPVRGIYQPDGIALYEYKGTPFLFTANEGDIRDYSGFSEVSRISSLTLDPVSFPDAMNLKQDSRLGRLNVTKTLGDNGNDGDYDQLYSFGGRSFSIWNGRTGQMIFDSKNELEKKSIEAGRYDDNRSDDKGVEPEALTIGVVGSKNIAFVGMERSNAIALYDISDPYNPHFLKILPSVLGPEGVTFIPAKVSGIGKSLLVTSSEVDGEIKIYKTE